jgi:hypothetical protein
MIGVMDWKSGSFSIVTSEGEKTVTGLVSDVFGIYDVGGRREHWAVTHIPTGLKLTAGNGFLAVESAKGFVEKISRKADWKTLGPGNPPPDLGMAVTEIWNEMIVEDCRLMGAIPIIDQSPWTSDENPFKYVGRNDRCPCGSGKKYKKCCLQ